MWYFLPPQLSLPLPVPKYLVLHLFSSVALEVSSPLLIEVKEDNQSYKSVSEVMGQTYAFQKKTNNRYFRHGYKHFSLNEKWSCFKAIFWLKFTKKIDSSSFSSFLVLFPHTLPLFIAIKVDFKIFIYSWLWSVG